MKLIILQLVVAVLSLLSKVGLYSTKVSTFFGKKRGFLLGIIGCSLGAWYSYELELYVYLIAELAGAIHLVLGYENFRAKTVRFQSFLKGITLLSMSLMAMVNETSTFLELGANIIGIYGFECFALQNFKRGWMMLIPGHSFYIYFMIVHEQWYIIPFQVASILIAIAAIIKINKELKKEQKTPSSNEWERRCFNVWKFVFCNSCNYTYSVEEFLLIWDNYGLLFATVWLFSKGGERLLDDFTVRYCSCECSSKTFVRK